MKVRNLNRVIKRRYKQTHISKLPYKRQERYIIQRIKSTFTINDPYIFDIEFEK